MAEGATRRGVPALVTLAAIVVVLAALRASKDLVVPIIISAVITMLVAPAEHALMARGWPRYLAVAAVLSGTLTALAVSFWALNYGLSAFLADLPAYQEGTARLVDHLLSFGARNGVDLTHLVRSAEVVGRTLDRAGSATRTFLVSLAGWVVVLGITGSMLVEAVDLPAKAREAFPADLLRRFRGLIAEQTQLMGVLTTGALLTAVGDAGVLLLLGIPSALLWAGLAFLLSYVPVVGFIVVVVPPAVATLLRFGPGRAVLVLAFMVAIHVAVTTLVVPRLMRRRIRITPFWTLLSLVFWGWLFGPAGAILAVPLTLFVKFLLESSEGTAPFGRLVEPCRVLDVPSGSAASPG